MIPRCNQTNYKTSAEAQRQSNNRDAHNECSVLILDKSLNKRVARNLSSWHKVREDIKRVDENSAGMDHQSEIQEFKDPVRRAKNILKYSLVDPRQLESTNFTNGYSD